jgi:hypothetical protein
MTALVAQSGDMHPMPQSAAAVDFGGLTDHDDYAARPLVPATAHEQSMDTFQGHHGQEWQTYYSPEQMQAWYQQQAMYMQEYGYAPDVAQHHAYAQYAAAAMDPTYGYYNYWGTEQQDDQVKRQRTKKPAKKASQSKPKARANSTVKLPPIRHTQMVKLERDACRIQEENLAIYKRLQDVRSSGYPGPVLKEPTKPQRPRQEKKKTPPKPEWQA